MQKDMLMLLLELAKRAWFQEKRQGPPTWDDHFRSLVIIPEYLQEALSIFERSSGEIKFNSHDTLRTPNGLTITLSEMLYSELSMDSFDDHLFQASVDQIAENLISMGFSESELYEDNCSGKRELLESNCCPWYYDQCSSVNRKCPLFPVRNNPIFNSYRFSGAVWRSLCTAYAWFLSLFARFRGSHNCD